MAYDGDNGFWHFFDLSQTKISIKTHFLIEKRAPIFL